MRKEWIIRTNSGRLLFRQLAWVQAALAFYRDPKPHVEAFAIDDWIGLRDISCSLAYIHSILKEYLDQQAHLRPFHEDRYKRTFRIREIFLKSYRFENLSILNPRDWIRRLKPKKCFRLSYRLQSLSILTARALFYARRRQTLPSEYLLATEGLPSSDVLNRWIQTGMGRSDPGSRKEFMAALGAYMGLIHRNGIYHRAFEYSTVVCVNPFRFYLIDLDHVMTVGAMLRHEQRQQVRRLEELLLANGAAQADLDVYRPAYKRQLVR